MSSGLHLLLLTSLTTTSWSSPQDDVTLRARFLRDYPAACVSLQQEARKNGTGVVTKKSNLAHPPQGQNDQDVVYTYYRLGENRRLDEAFESNTPNLLMDNSQGSYATRRSFVYTPIGAFLAARETPEKRFQLIAMREGKSPTMDQMWAALVESAFTVLGSSITDYVIENPKTVIDKVSEVSEGGRALVKVEFHRKDTGSNGKARPVRAWLLLDPANGWVLESYHIEHAGGQVSSGRISYHGNGRDTRSVDRAEHEFRNAKSQVTSSVTYNAVSFRTGNLSEEDFTMAAFGLPELSKPLVKRGPLEASHWLLIAGVFALLAGLVFRYLAVRTRQPAPSNPT